MVSAQSNDLHRSRRGSIAAGSLRRAARFVQGRMRGQKRAGEVE
ncbi:hypothetical protein LC55x_3554 [Lysobacter capsici]|nr:hypothetical protein LC55x_3554 [Lysobacter capsici]